MENNKIVSVAIPNKDTNVAAMVKVLAMEIGGPEAVRWNATKEQLFENGYIYFKFHTEAVANALPKMV
jgi:hypothetical protein